MAQQPKDLADKTPQVIRSQDFASVYANFARFDPTVWDLKISFGEIAELNPDGGTVEYHTAVSMSWTAVKVMALYLALNVAMHEHDHGLIDIPKEVLQGDIKHLSDKPFPLDQLIGDAAKIRKLSPKKS
jgi:hypothetical protein